MNSDHRFKWIDAVKGIAILLVMWGHVQEVSPLRIWIASFHVPIFLVCTGYLYAAVGRKKINPLTILKKLQYPYLTFSTIAILSQCVFMLFKYGFNQAIKTTAMNLYKTLCGFGIDAIWFIPSYFIAVIVFFWLLNRKRNVTVFGILACAALGVFTEVFLSRLKGIISSTLYSILSYPIVAIVRGLVCSIFVGGGYCLYSISKKARQKYIQNTWIINVCGCACLVASIAVAEIVGEANISWLKYGRFPGLLYVAAFTGSVGIMWLIHLLTTIHDSLLLKYCGKNSLIIMGTHMSMYLTAFSIYLLTLLGLKPAINAGIQYYLFGVGCVVIMIIIEIPIIYLMNNPLKRLIGRS